MPIQGLVKLRRHLFGRQSTFGDTEPATRAYPFSGTPDVNLNWTDPGGDFGSIDPIAAPTRGAPDIGASLTAERLNYNDLVLPLCAVFGGGETPTGGGTAKTWSHTPASDTADDFDYFTYEFGDDVTTDWFQLRDGIVTDFEVTGENQEALAASMTWLFTHAASTGSTDSPADAGVPHNMTVDAAAVPIYLKDGSIFIDSTPGAIGSTQILDALHSFRLHVTQEVDQKRFANGSQEFEINGFGRGARMIELECTFAKTSDTVGTGSESDAWMSDTAVDRYFRLYFESTAFAQTDGSPDVPYSWTVDIPMRYYTRAEGDIGGNTTVVLTAHAFFEAVTLDSVFESTLVNTLALTSFAS
jgi:hypothetical protein